MPDNGAATALEHAASSSQADTEPLSFEEDEEEADQEIKQSDDPQKDDMAVSADEDAPGSVDGSVRDESMNDVDAAGTSHAATGLPDTADPLTAAEDAEGEDADAVGSDDDDVMGDDTAQEAATADDTGAAHSSAAGAAFSDDSELTDESDDGEGLDEDAEGDEDDDDEMGGDDEDSDEDEDAEGEEEDEDADGEHQHDTEDEDEAAKGLAALTAGQDGAVAQADSISTTGKEAATSATSGLDGLAVLAAAGAGAEDADQLQGGESDSESTTSSRAASIRARRGRFTAKPRLGSRLNEVMVPSEHTSDQDEDAQEGEEGEGYEDEQAGDEDGHGDEAQVDEGEEGDPEGLTGNSRDMSSLGHLASAAKRTAARSGPTAGLLAGAPAITIEEAASGAASLASSREASPKADEEEDEAVDAPGEEDSKEGKGEDEKEIETPVQELEEAAAEEEPSTDEAAIRRQEAMEALTKIEIGFAVLRDKLYVERMDEISKESEMIMEGTHPDLIYLTNFIEARRERRLKLVEMWFEQQQKQYERVAHAEEAAAWNNWRNEVVRARKEPLDDVARKRRKLDREKRTLDGPRPARRHQIFETELVRNPEYDAAQARHRTTGKKKKDARQQEIEDLEEMGAYVAYPDLRGAEDSEAWMDMERMGVQPDVRLMPGMGYYRMDEMGMEPPYGMYVVDGQPPPGVEMMPPFGGHPPNGVLIDRGFDARDRPVPGGFAVDGYGNAPPPGYGGPIPAQRGRGPLPEGLYTEGEPSIVHKTTSRKRAGSPSGGTRHVKQGEERSQGRKSDFQGTKRGHAGVPTRSPPGATRKNAPVHGGVHRAALPMSDAAPPLPPQTMKGPYGAYGGGPSARAMHDDGYYDMGNGGPPPMSGYGPPPPSGPGHAQMLPGGDGGGYGPGPMMGSPGQPMPPQPGPPPMNHPMHGPPPVGQGPPGGFQPGRRVEPMYPR